MHSQSSSAILGVRTHAVVTANGFTQFSLDLIGSAVSCPRRPSAGGTIGSGTSTHISILERDHGPVRSKVYN
jgi:hypothetical protein